MKPRITRVAAAVTTAVAVLAGSATDAGAAAPSAYPSCGSYWNRNTPPSVREQRVNRCIVRAARAGRHARAVAVLTTVEGDPIVQYVFVLGVRDVLVVVDSTRDSFAGPGGWSRLRCRGLGASGGRLVWKRCRETGDGKPVWLAPYRLGG